VRVPKKTREELGEKRLWGFFNRGGGQQRGGTSKNPVLGTASGWASGRKRGVREFVGKPWAGGGMKQMIAKMNTGLFGRTTDTAPKGTGARTKVGCGKKNANKKKNSTLTTPKPGAKKSCQNEKHYVKEVEARKVEDRYQAS